MNIEQWTCNEWLTLILRNEFCTFRVTIPNFLDLIWFRAFNSFVCLCKKHRKVFCSPLRQFIPIRWVTIGLHTPRRFLKLWILRAEKNRYFFLHPQKINFMLILHRKLEQIGLSLMCWTFKAFLQTTILECFVVTQREEKWEIRRVCDGRVGGLAVSKENSYILYACIYVHVSDGMKKVYIIKSSVNKCCDGMVNTAAE